MIVIHRGAGMLVPAFGILAALLMNILTVKIFSDGYYQEHRWPKLTVLLFAGACCFISGTLLKKKRAREAQKEQEHIQSLSPKFGAVKAFTYAGPRDHLMYIPLQYWSLVYLIAALFCVFTSR